MHCTTSIMVGVSAEADKSSHESFGMLSSRLYYHYRMLGMVSNNIKGVLEVRGSECFITTCVGKVFQTYNCEKLNLVVSSDEFTDDIHHLIVNPKNGHMIVGYGCNKIKILKRGTKIIDEFTCKNVSSIKKMMLVGDALLIVDNNNMVNVLDLYSQEIYLEMSLSDNGGDFNVSALCHPSTYLNKILFASSQGCLQLWNIRTGRLVHNFEKIWGDIEISVLEQSTAVDIVAIGMADGHIYLYNLKIGNILYKFYQNYGFVTCITFRTDGFGYMATGSQHGHITIWDLDRNQLASCIMDAHQSSITTLEYLPNSTILLSTSDDNSIKEWIFDGRSSNEQLSDEGQARLYKYRCGHCSPIQKLRFFYSNTKSTVNTNNQYTILSCGQDNSLRYFNLYRDEQNVEISQGNIESVARKKNKNIQSMRLSKIIDFSFANQREFFWDNCVTCHKKDHYPRTWNVRNKKIGKYMLGYNCTNSFNINGQYPLVCEMTRCGSLVAIGYNKGSLIVYNMQSGLFYREFVDNTINKTHLAHQCAIKGICIDNVNKFMVSIDEMSVLKFWNFQKATKIHEIHCIEEQIYHLRLHNENLLLALAIYNKKNKVNYIKVIDMETRKLIRVTHDRNFKHINDMAFNVDGRWLIVATSDSLLATWDIVTNKLIDCFITNYVVQSMDLSPYGDFLILAYNGKRGIDVLANKFVFDPTIVLLPLDPNYNPLKCEVDSNTSINNTKDDWNDIVTSFSYINTQKDNNGEGLITIAQFPESKWFSLANIDLIKERNKPKQPKIILKSAPFFLPTVSGLEPSFDISLSKIDGNTEIDLTNRFKKLKTTLKRSNLLSKIEEYSNSTGDIKRVRLIQLTEFLSKLNPSSLNCELTYLSTDMEGNLDILLNFLQFLNDAVIWGSYFEFFQGCISLFLKIHSKTLLSHSLFFSSTLNNLLDSITKRQKILEDSIHQSLCILDFIRSNKVSF